MKSFTLTATNKLFLTFSIRVNGQLWLFCLLVTRGRCMVSCNEEWSSVYLGSKVVWLSCSCDNPLCRRSVARRRSFQHNNCVSFSVPLLVSGSKLIRFKKKSKKVSWDFSIGKVVYLVVQNSFCVSIFKKSIVWNDLILLYQTLSALDINSKNISYRNNEHVNLSDAGQVGRYLWNLYSAYGNGSRWWKVWTKVCFHLKLK